MNLAAVLRFVLSSMLLGGAARAADVPVCEKYRKMVPAKSDYASAGEAEKLAKAQECNPVADYYGVGQEKANPVRARKCALMEAQSGWKKDHLDAAVLMMIYANGEQTARNFDVAEHFICELNLTANETARWLDYLEAQRAKKHAGEKIEFCQRFFEDSYRSACAEMRRIHQQALRTQKFNEMEKKFTPGAKRAL